jgi:hypothetical protein
MKTLWQRFVSRHRRIMADVRQVELEMTKENLNVNPTMFPKRPYKLSTIILFCMFMFFVAAAWWALFKNLR